MTRKNEKSSRRSDDDNASSIKNMPNQQKTVILFPVSRGRRDNADC